MSAAPVRAAPVRPSVSLWLPDEDADEDDRALTTGELREGGAKDEVLLFVEGELAAQFEVRRGLGARVLRECGLRRS